MIKKMLFFILVLISMTTIFIFSSRNSSESNSTSKTLIEKGLVVYEKISGKNLNKEYLVKKLNYPVRKIAHFTLYFILGLFVYSFISLFINSRRIIISSIITITYAFFDEFHQMFVSGRSPLLKDVLIDSIGAVMAILLSRNIKKKENLGGK